MADHVLTLGEEDGSSLYGHDNRSILSASTSSRVTLNGPRQRPKGPRTSDISRSSLVERPSLPLSPLAKEISVVQEEVPTPAQSFSPNRDSIPLANPQPSRRLSLGRFSLRRSKLKPHVEDTFIGDDPFGSTPHPPVRLNTNTHLSQQAKALVAGDVNVPARIKKSLSLIIPVSQNRADSEILVPLRSKRSFFRRMADKFTRSQTIHIPESQYQRTLFKDTKQQVSLPYAEYLTMYPSSQLPTPASSVRPPSALPSLLVIHPDELSSVHSHEASAMSNPSLVRLPESVSIRTLPAIPVDERTVNNITYIQSTPSTSPSKVPDTDSIPYSIQLASASWQPITPISPLNPPDIYPIRESGLSTTHSFHNSFSNDSSSRPTEKSDVGRHSSSRQQAASVRSIPILRDPPLSDRRKAISVRSQQHSPPAKLNFNSEVSRKGENWVELHGQHHIREDSQALMNLDKVMFEKELARERERRPWPTEKDRLIVHERKSPETSNPIHNLAIPLGKRKSKRQSDISLNNLGKNKPDRIFSSKPNSAPNPSSSESKRDLGFSINLETKFDVNTYERLYPDVLYTVNQTSGSPSSLPDTNSPGRRSLPTSSKNIDKPPRLEHTENGYDKVSRWLVSTTTKANEMNIPANTSPVTNRDITYDRTEEVKRHKGKGKTPDRGNYNG